jgi:hypothetical protein
MVLFSPPDRKSLKDYRYFYFGQQFIIIYHIDQQFIVFTETNTSYDILQPHLVLGLLSQIIKVCVLTLLYHFEKCSALYFLVIATEFFHQIQWFKLCVLVSDTTTMLQNFLLYDFPCLRYNYNATEFSLSLSLY